MYGFGSARVAGLKSTIRLARTITALFLGSAVALGCGQETAERAHSSRSSIVGGAEDGSEQYSAVFFLTLNIDNGARGGCSATLITPRVLLTAAHCLDPRVAGGQSLSVTASNAAVAPDAGSPAWLPVADFRRHPDWSLSDLHSNDIGVVLLAQPFTTASPIPFNPKTLAAGDVGLPLTAVGYGITGPDRTDYGRRRAVALSVRALDAKHIILGNQTDKGICHGDSGGPSLHTFPDGVTRVVGVHSYSVPTSPCVDGEDTRVDLFASFIREFIDASEGPTCGEDGLCATGACPKADPDCTRELARCAEDSQCQHRMCVSDPKTSERYCSRPCQQADDCPSGTACTGGQCLKVTPMAGPPPTGPRASSELDPPGCGCASNPEGMTAMILALVVRVLRSRRRVAHQGCRR